MKDTTGIINLQLRKDIIALLVPLPCMQTERRRQAILIAAGLDVILGTIDLTGGPHEFVPLLIKELEQFGKIHNKPALIVFLQEVAIQVGQDKQKVIQDLCARILAEINKQFKPASKPEITPDDFAIKDRRVDAAVPSEVELGQSIDLYIQVRFPESPLLEIEKWPPKRRPSSIEVDSDTLKIKFPVNRETGTLESATILVHVVTQDFTIKGEARKSIEVPPEDYSKKIPFLLIPRKPGACRINVEIYTSDNLFLGDVPLDMTVTGILGKSMLVGSLYLPVKVTEQQNSRTSSSGNTKISTGGDYFENIEGNPVVITGSVNIYQHHVAEQSHEKTSPLNQMEYEQIANRSKVFHNLPQPDYEWFVGREAELTQIHQLLHPAHRAWLVTIDGIGGIGKSALALEIAHHYLRQCKDLPAEERFDAIVWTSAKHTVLTADGIHTRHRVLHSLNDLYIAIAVALRREDLLRVSADMQDEVVLRALKQQRTLLIVDNLETVDDEAVLNFLRELPAPTKALVTTRRRLDVAYPIRLTGMPLHEAEALMRQWEKAAAQLTIHESTQPATVKDEIMRRLHQSTGGVPLAMEWSMAQIRAGYRSETVLKRLEQPTGDIARFCFAETVEQIKGQPAYILLLTLSLCANTAGREVLQYVTGLSESACDDGLVQLEKLSLVNKQGDRFWLLPLTKLYAASEFQQASKGETLRETWIKYFSTLCREYSSGYWNWRNYDWLLAEGENILALANWAIANEQPAIALAFTRAIKRYLDIQGRWNELLQYGTQLAHLAQDIRDKPTEAWIHVHWLGWFHISRNTESAEYHIRQALSLYQDLNDVKGTCFAMRSLGQIARFRGNHEEDETICQQAMRLAETNDFGDGIAYVHMELGRLRRDQERWEESKRHWEAIVDWCENHVDEADLDTSFLMSALGDFGWVEHQLEHHERGRSLLERSLAFTEHMGGKGTTTLSRLRLARIEKALGNHQTALRYTQEVLFWSERLNMPKRLKEAQSLFHELTDDEAAQPGELI